LECGRTGAAPGRQSQGEADGVTPAGFFSVLGPNMSKGPFMEGWALRDKLPMPHLRGAITGTPLV
jgi:hypothetical protein